MADVTPATVASKQTPGSASVRARSAALLTAIVAVGRTTINTLSRAAGEHLLAALLRLIRVWIFIAAFALLEHPLLEIARFSMGAANPAVIDTFHSIELGSAWGVGILFAVHFLKALWDLSRHV
jgi:predicted ABC-type sugar transport system permease subunit